MQSEPRRVLVVRRPAALRHGPPRRLRTGPRADDSPAHRHAEHPGRDPVSADAEERGFLSSLLEEWAFSSPQSQRVHPENGTTAHLSWTVALYTGKPHG